jgi:hypothetical protein
MLIRHPVFGIIGGNSADQLTVPGVAGYYSRLSALRFTERFGAEQQAEARFLFYAAMTGNTFFIEERLYFCIVIHGFVPDKAGGYNQCRYEDAGNEKQLFVEFDFHNEKQGQYDM